MIAMKRIAHMLILGQNLQLLTQQRPNLNDINDWRLSSEAANRRVDAVTANTGNRCLITNCLPEYAVYYAHLLPRVAKDSEVGCHRFSKFIIG
jgi:hypothetical protein